MEAEKKTAVWLQAEPSHGTPMVMCSACEGKIKKAYENLEACPRCRAQITRQ